MHKNYNKSKINCGRVFNPVLPSSLDQSQAPIVLGEVNINTSSIPNPCVSVKFSEFINFEILGVNPTLRILYRLVRIDNITNNQQVLQEWQFQFESARLLEVTNVNTNQPTVLNYTDCLDEYVGENITYQVQIINIETNSVISYAITNKSIIANAISKVCDNLDEKSDFGVPFIETGKVFNPVLPLNLKNNDLPVELTRLTICYEACTHVSTLIDFSAFLTSVLKGNRFNDLSFRLIKLKDNNDKEILRTWQFRRSFVNDTNITEPVVYNYCECLQPKYDVCYTYVFELVKANLSENSYYNLSQKIMTALVYHNNENTTLWVERSIEDETSL